MLTRGQIHQWALWQRAEGNSDATIAERERLLTAFTNQTGADLLRATEDDVAAFLASCRHLRPATRATYFSHLKAWYAWLVYVGVREGNPCDRLRGPAFPRRHPRPVSDQQLERLLATRMHRRTRTMILLAAFQGLRVHEVAKLHGRDVDVRDETLRVIGKGDVDALLPLHPLVAAESQLYPARDWWFPTNSTGRDHGLEHVTGRAVSDIVALAMRRAGIAAGGAHRLRHWYATTLIGEGASTRVVQELLRHASLQTTQIYTQVTLEQQRRALGLLRMPSDVLTDLAA